MASSRPSSGLLDGQTDVRTAYAAWVTPGDVLARVLDLMPPVQRDFGPIMANFLQKELCAEQYVNLGQAGHNPEDRIPLARVFVDLPVGDSEQAPRPSRSPVSGGSESKPIDAIGELMMLAGQRLDPGSNPRPSGNPTEGVAGLAVPVMGRVVLIGGPGQGKSTLTQFMCQLHRVALLATGLCPTPIAEAADACDLIRGQCEVESLTLPAMARFPVRLELSHFAAALADRKSDSLFDYLLQRIRQRTNRDLCPGDLGAWLGAYPWLLVINGLDEVPASSNRQQVLRAIQDFLVDANGCNADLLLVATSRPQGYNDDFDPRYYRHRHLLPLDVPRAIHYAHRLAVQRWGGDPDKQQRILERLTRAGKEEATAFLMRSPLQVTIMTLLIKTVGQPPRERWRLFSEYYQVIFRREKERAILAADLLNTYQKDIDAIHEQVGLRLQERSERTGGTAALLTEDEFSELIDERLRAEGHKGEERDKLRCSIIRAAMDRLVFLVAPQQGKVGFEIRSLQEFMAAQRLMDGSDEAVSRRLRAIAPAAYWRNVVLFAAGRCFQDRQHLRDSLHALCCGLNEGDIFPDGGKLERATLAGSRLALEIL